MILAPPPPSDNPLQDRWLHLLYRRVTDIVPVPATATAPGEVGQIAFDSSYLYICHSLNTWKRVAIATW